MAVVVDEKKCTGCGICEDVCPKDAIHVINSIAVVNDNCIDCSICVKRCPENAISKPSQSLQKGGATMDNTQRGRGRGEGRGMGRRVGMGSGGYCVCPNCGEKIPHQRGIPCQSVQCPKCGSNMMRR